MLQVILFVVGSIALLPLSWRSFRNARAHGFYRFFAFEFLLSLILLNAPVWFRAPFSARQWAAWCLGAASIPLAIEGFRLLRMIGKPGPHDVVSTNLPLERTTKLVTAGVYRWIRHPLYASLVALALSAYLKDPLGVWSILFTLGAVSSLLATAIAEEQENVQRFGDAYVRYMRSTKRFIPFVF
ncbi:MAG: isoprenylcysteine carboxylmethyltransferase family protein [Terracidiphilus sp.]|jgi:protein-S-isoprenylcysteine O-methyltransferase Ste14